MDEPLAVAITALDALDRGEWRRVADLTDPEDVRAWVEHWLQIPDRPPSEITAEQIRRHEPDMPEEVARYHAEQLNRRAAETAGTLHGLFAGVDTRAELARLEPAEALARYIQAQDPRWQFEERVKARPELRAAVPRMPPWCVREAVGVVHEGDERAHVVYRVRWPSAEAEHAGGGARPGAAEGELAVATLRRTPAGWRLRLRGELFEHHGGVVIRDVHEADAPSDGSADA